MSTVPRTDMMGALAPQARRNEVGAGTGQQLAWQREMERAQASSWLSHGPLPHSGPAVPLNAVDAKSSPPGVHNAAQMVQRLPLSRTEHTASLVSVSVKEAEVLHSGGGSEATASLASPSTRAAALAPQKRAATEAPTIEATATGVARREPFAVHVASQQPLIIAPPSVMGDETPAEAAPVISARPQRWASERVPVRMHVQSDGRHADVWLGVDAPLVGHLPQLAAAVVQSLRRSGRMVGSLVCNGQTWYAGGAAGAAATQTTVHPSRSCVDFAPLIKTTQGET